MVYVSHFRCIKCSHIYKYEEIISLPIPRCIRCESCLDIEYDFDAIRAAILTDGFMREKPSHWKYWAFLPVKDLSKIVTMGEGGTPLLENPRLAKGLRLLIKYEAANPTGSFKDRGSSLEITKANEFNKKMVVVASTGNMGASVAAYASFAGLICKVFVPSFIGEVKTKQIKAYGGEIEEVEGDYAYAIRRAEEYVAEHREAFLTGDYPWRSEGTKTIGFEIADQLYWRIPDYVAAPIGNGTLVWSLYEAFRELKVLGITSVIPRIIGVQVEGCDPVVHAWEQGLWEIVPIQNPQTIASAIACGDPIDGLAALEAIRESGGMGIRVSDEEVLQARNMLGKNGFFVEPSGAAAFAGVLILKEKLEGKTVVCLATGHGLKDMYGL